MIAMSRSSRCALLLVVALAAGCGSLSLRYRPWPQLQVDTQALAKRYPKAPAVVVQRTIHYRFTDEVSARFIREEYAAIAVLDDGGEQYAVVHVPIGRGTLSFLRARTRLPDGTMQDVTPEEQHDVVTRGPSALAGDDEKVKVFRLPRVHVGSIVEYSYGVEYPVVPLARAEPISSAIPVQHYHLEFASERGFDGRVHIYNREVEIKRDRVDGTDRYYLDIADVPAFHEELLAPPITVTEPWWALAVSQARNGRSVIDIDTWDKIGAGLSQQLYLASSRLFDGVTLAPTLGTCHRNHRCAVQAALDRVNEVSDLVSFANGGNSIKPLKETLATRKVNSFEKTLLLYRALADVGVTAHVAFLSRSAIREADPNFPSLGRGDHAVLYIDTLSDGTEPFYVDPSCEWCALGELPEWSAGRQTQILMRVPTGDQWHSDPTGTLRWGMTPDTRESSPNVSRQIIDATLAVDGKVSGQIAHEMRNAAAVDMHIFRRTWSDEQWQKEGDRDLQEHSKTAQREGAVTTEWDKKTARWRMSVGFSVNGYATPDRDQLIVPLTLLHAGYDHDYSDEPRVHDVMMRVAQHNEDTLTLHVPAGYVVGELPKSMTLHAQAADGVFEVSVPKPDVIRVRRILRMHVGHWGPDEFAELVALIRNLESARQLAIVLKKGG